MGAQTDLIRTTILQRVRANQLIPGDPVDEAALRQEFKVSGTPVREALTQLEAVGLIERAPRAGARILKPDIKRLIGMIEVHAELEGAVAHFAARRITPFQAEELLRTAAACEAHVANPGHQPGSGYYALNVDFHKAIISGANSVDLADMMFTSADKLISFFRARHRLRGEPQRSAREHRTIADLILAGEADKARDLMISHVLVDGATILDVVQKMSERFDDEAPEQKAASVDF